MKNARIVMIVAVPLFVLLAINKVSAQGNNVGNYDRIILSSPIPRISFINDGDDSFGTINAFSDSGIPLLNLISDGNFQISAGGGLNEPQLRITNGAQADALVLNSNGVVAKQLNTEGDIRISGIFPSIRFEQHTGEPSFIVTQPGEMDFGVGAIDATKFRITSGALNDSLVLNSTGLKVVGENFRVENDQGDSRFRVTTGAEIDSLIVNSAGVTAKDFSALNCITVDGNQPEILFDQLDIGRIDSISSGTGGLNLGVGGSRKIAIFSNALEDGLRLENDGTSVKQSLTIDNSDGQSNLVAVEINHNNGQDMGLLSANDQSGTDGGGIGLYTSNSFVPFFVHDSANDATLTANADGVGIGTFFAEAPLHLYSDATTLPAAKILIENEFPSTGLREMLALVNNGGSRFTLANTDNQTKWAFASDSLGRFTFSLDGTGGPELAVSTSGRVTMGPGSQTNFDLRPNGNLMISGTLIQSSDKNLKTEFQPVDTKEVLAKVAKLPITTWRFNSDPHEVRHMGPMAQDFRNSFGLGYDDKTIATVDAAGVTLAAIKELAAIVNAKDEQIDQFRYELESHERLVAQQQERLDKLSIRLELLENEVSNK